MPRVNLKLTTLTLNKGRYSRALDEAIQTQLRMAARAFLQVAIPAIPIRTGFARGSLTNLSVAAGIARGGESNLSETTPAGRFLSIMKRLRQHSFARTSGSGLFGLTKSSLRQAGVTGRLEYYRDGKRKILKTPQSGRDFSTKPEQIFQTNGLVYTFNFESFISYFNINDLYTNPRNAGTPWNSFNMGRATFLNYLRTIGLKRLPKVQAFLTEHFVGVSSGTITTTFIDR